MLRDISSLSVGDVCVVCHEEDEVWYRALIHATVEDKVFLSNLLTKNFKIFISFSSILHKSVIMWQLKTSINVFTYSILCWYFRWWLNIQISAVHQLWYQRKIFVSLSTSSKRYLSSPSDVLYTVSYHVSSFDYCTYNIFYVFWGWFQ